MTTLHPQPPLDEPPGRGASVVARSGVRTDAVPLPAAWGAVVAAALSLSPSLLPRGPAVQAVVLGITAAIGYGVGGLLAGVWRAFADRPTRPARPGSWRVFAILAPLLLLAALVLGVHWQRRILDLMGATAPSRWWIVPMLLGAVMLGCLLVLAARGVRRIARRLTALLERRIGRSAARALGWLIVTVGAYLLVTGLLLDGFVTAADRSFALRDGATDPGVVAPESTLRSGSSSSLIPWDSLGRQGRNFVAGGPDGRAIQQLRGDTGQEPVRVYAGIASAAEPEDRAQLAVDDLVRAGGFQRDVLLVATTTGTGWLDPGAMASFEYLTGGDSAIVSMQYSYLPSWLSYLVDQPRARQAGRELFDAVYERWSRLPADDRPALYVFGESLGAFGAEAAFSGEFDLRNRTSGALFVGTPSFATLHREFTVGRDVGSLTVAPVYREGRTVRFASDPTEAAERTWEGPRVLYLQHPSDPITWWEPRLMTRRPSWLAEPRGHDVLDAMVWLPMITFWQVTADLPFALDVPDGHGHRYTRESVEAWRLVLQLDDVPAETIEAIRAAITTPE